MYTRRMFTHRSRLFGSILLGLLFFSACNMPSRATPTASGVDLINTAAAQTVTARLTQAAGPPPTGAGITPVPGGETPLPTTEVTGNTPVPTATNPPAATAVPASPTAVPCDKVKFVKDITYPDNSEVAAGSSFVKTWRLQNAGSCTWTTAYALVFVGKDRMGAPDAVPLAGSIAPGQTIDVSVTLTAPSDGGTYRADFKLRNASNAQFGIGPKDEPFYVQIKVPVATGILFDFISQAPSATWTSGIGGKYDTNLTFGAEDTDPNGVAKIKDGVQLETGATSGKVLLTVPKHDPAGSISGTFPAYTVQSGDLIRGRLGFLANADGKCGAGNVLLQILYLDDKGNYNRLGRWEKTCDGKLIQVEVDLSSIKGKTVKFVFTVDANGSAEDNWVVWNSVRVEHP